MFPLFRAALLPVGKARTHESCLQFYWMQQELFCVMATGVLVFTHNVCRTVKDEEGPAEGATQPSHLHHPGRCAWGPAMYLHWVVLTADVAARPL
jgi:hypothetical protein